MFINLQSGTTNTSENLYRDTLHTFHTLPDIPERLVNWLL